MTGHAIKNMLDKFDLDLLDCVEKRLYNKFRKDYNKRFSLMQVINDNPSALSHGLMEIYELMQENEINYDEN